MDQKTLDNRILIHKTGLKKRFPSLPNDIISSSWSGIVSRSSNGSQIFEKLNKEFLCRKLFWLGYRCRYIIWRTDSSNSG